MHLKRALALFLSLLFLLVGCTSGEVPQTDATTTTTVFTPSEPAPGGQSYRILFSSDIHCTDLRTFGNIENDKRMQHWVDSILAEHARQPIDLLIINGDTSLDHVEGGGADLLSRPITTKTFVKEYLSQLPDEIEVFIMPGNHEQYSHSRWYEITGNHRQGYRVVGNNLFLFLDTYNADLDPTTNHSGKYSGVDVSYAEMIMECYPTHNVYLVSHYFDIAKESVEFQRLITNKRIVGLFQGHTHRASVVRLGQSYKRKTIAQTGQFAYPNPEEVDAYWGFRELIITEDSAYSRYIVVKSSHILLDATYVKRRIRDSVCYYGTMPER